MKPIPLVPPPMTTDADGAPGSTGPGAEGSAPANGGNDVSALVPDAVRTEALRPGIVEAISTVYDPEIPVNIWELGLIYDVIVDAAGVAGVRMTLTAPGCPAAQSLPVEVAEKVKRVPGVSDAKVEVVWEPGWTKDRMSEAAKLQLGLW
jgi:FeS assembly SUF system protein